MSTHPVELLLVQVPARQASSEILPTLKQLSESDVVRIVKVFSIKKNAEKNVLVLELDNLNDEICDAIGQLVSNVLGIAVPIASDNSYLVSQLKQLAQLREAGSLTEEEFRTAKTILLAKAKLR